MTKKGECEKCAHVHKQVVEGINVREMFECRKNPPQVIVVIREGALRQPVQAVQSIFPMVDGAAWCSGFEDQGMVLQ